MKQININKEWSWIFSEGLGKAYGEYLNGSEFNVLTLKSAKAFFYFLSQNNIIETNKIDWSKTRGTYSKDFNPNSAWGDKWTPPPLKEHFKGKINPQKPIITILNKYNVEWGIKPFNYIAINLLDKLITRLKKDYEIYYVRQDKNLQAKGYWDDVQGLEFEDHKMIKEKHPEVTTIYEYLEANKRGFNEAQLDILGDSKHVITTAGGGAFLSAYFGEDVVIFNCSDCKSCNREVWSTNSWLKVFNNSNIFGFQDYDELFNFVDKRW